MEWPDVKLASNGKSLYFFASSAPIQTSQKETSLEIISRGAVKCQAVSITTWTGPLLFNPNFMQNEENLYNSVYGFPQYGFHIMHANGGK
ncbi:MAG: hypothetical protein R2802_01860 [Flavobacteriaceae bacterium]|nr:hypothetical protein [Mangrovimonas sp.]MCB0437021.1 hypothetical protein [Mangrovimonas sp.]HPF97134.1 hypothetical protein [Mangrovimonas sp.]HRV56092.1 hypothetical protein [Mangrovimonas sp.]